MLCYVMLCYVMLCYVMLCYVMLCYVMLCYVMLRWSTGLIPSQSPVEDIADDNISVIKIYIYYKECK